MHVLVVDGDSTWRAGLERVFCRRGHTVTVCDSGATAIELVERRTYELLVLEWVLPDRDGTELVAQLRARGRTIAVLMVTARESDQDTIRALAAGVDDFIAKPNVTSRVLLARAEALLRRSRLGPAPRRIEAFGIAVDEGTRRATRHALALDLAPREFTILAKLTANAGVAVSRSELVACAWGEGVHVSATALESVVKRLRAKLGDSGCGLLALKRRGYALTNPPPGAASHDAGSIDA